VARSSEEHAASAGVEHGPLHKTARGDTATWSADFYLDHDVLIAGGRIASGSGVRVSPRTDIDAPGSSGLDELIVQGVLRLGGDATGHVTYQPASEGGREWSGVCVERDGGP
jgi:hypothetical protein